MRVSFIIPVYGNWHLTNQILVDIRDHSSSVDEIVIVDDYGLDLETEYGLEWWVKNSGLNIVVVNPPENLGFLKASNLGESVATGDFIVQISSDVRVEDDLAGLVRKILRDDPKTLIGGIVYEDTTGWNEFDGRVFPYAEGWLMGCTKEAWRVIGFDERYSPNDFEDVDSSTTALFLGYKLVSLNNPKIRHLGAKTIGYTDARRELTERNREKFRQKWLP